VADDREADAAQSSRQRQIGWREVLTVAAVVVVVVLVAAQLTSGVSRDIRTPATILVLIGGTAWVLWRITRRPADG
jgi:anti-sigma-K factor RskA